MDDEDFIPALQELARLNEKLQNSGDVAQFFSENEAELKQLQARFHMCLDTHQ